MNDSLVNSSILFKYGYAVLPENFMNFSKSQQISWFINLVTQANIVRANNMQYFGIMLSKEQALNLSDYVLSLFQTYSPNSYLAIDTTKSGLFNQAEFSKILDIRWKLQSRGSEVAFCEDFTVYNFETVCEANLKLDRWAEEINNMRIDGKELSPVEKYLKAYSYVTQFMYKESPENYQYSRNLISVLTGNKIVCVGFGNLLSELCRQIGVDCITQNVATFSSRDSNHLNYTVRIKDDKYGIDGVFYADPCWDCCTAQNEVSIAHALLTYSDLPKIFGEGGIRILSDTRKVRTLNMKDDAGSFIRKLFKEKEDKNKTLTNYLLDNVEFFSRYIDEAVALSFERSSTITPKKENLDTIIKDLINYGLQADEYRRKGLFNESVSSWYYQSKKMIGDYIMYFTKKRGLQDFKKLLFKELKSYIPEPDSKAYENLIRFQKYETLNQNDALADDKRLKTKSVSFSQLEKILQNLSRASGLNQAEAKQQTNTLLRQSLNRAINVWKNPPSGDNAFSKMTQAYLDKRKQTPSFLIRNNEDLETILPGLRNKESKSAYSARQFI